MIGIRVATQDKNYWVKNATGNTSERTVILTRDIRDAARYQDKLDAKEALEIVRRIFSKVTTKQIEGVTA